MTDGAVERLRARASRGDYASMARLANALYARGLGPRDVLRECYGVDLPAEFFMTAAERTRKPHLLATFTNQPWKLAVPPEDGGPPPSPTELLAGVEQRIFARDPDLVPLMRLTGSGTAIEHPMLCYRLTELQAGTTAVFAIKATAAAHDPIVHRGDSLLAVLHAHHAETLTHLEFLLDQPSNWGFGALDEQAVAEVRSLVERVEELRREVATRQDD